jgi:hypothetical protein
MSARPILYPMLAMVLLTAIVAVVMYRRRLGEMRLRGIHPQKLATSAQMAATLEDTRAADNFRNLFETPVLFYAVVLTTYVTQSTNVAYVALAWTYVATRGVHTWIHCSYNRVIHRFLAFVASLLLLWTLWALLAFDLLLRGRG